MIRVVRAELHRLTVTGADRDAPSAIVIDADLLAAAGLVPLEVVTVVSDRNGQQWETYVVPAPGGSGKVVVSGGGSALFELGHVLSVRAEALLERDALEEGGLSAQLVKTTESNGVDRVVRRRIRMVEGAWKLDELDPSSGHPLLL